MWATCGASSLLLMGAGAEPWPVVLLAGVVCTAITFLLWRMKKTEESRLFWILQWCWAEFMMGMILKQTGECWNLNGNGKAWIPVVLMILAYSAAGRKQPGNVGALLWRITALLYVPILAVGLWGIHPQRIGFHVEVKRINPYLMTGFLLPWAGGILHRTEEGKSSRYLLMLMALATTASVITAGTLSLKAAENYKNGFYEAVRGMRIAGVTERFESLLSVGMTIGWFCALSLLAAIVWQAREKLKLHDKAKVAEIVIPLVIMWGINEKNVEFSWIGSVAIWGIVPILSRLKQKRKKNGKTA